MKNGLSLSLAVVVAVLGVVALTGQGQGGSVARQTWEYKTWVFNVSGAKTTLYEDGRELPGSSTPVSRAPELGAQGWELVSVAAVQVGSSSPINQYVYWFKRPK